MSRVINFSPGPATLPLSVLEEIRDELLDFQASGISIMEHSHRGKQFVAVQQQATALVRELLSVPDTHQVLWLQGGASGQFAWIPMSFLQGKGADYVNTGAWSNKAFKAAKFYGEPRWAGSGEVDGRMVKAPMDLDVNSDAQYVHLTSNATIAGVQYHDVPDTKGRPLVADMSSDLLWRPIDVSKYAMIYAGAQKNLGPAGVTLVIINKEFMATGNKDLPEPLRYDFIASKDSAHNTPPVFSIYSVGKVLQWVKAQGGAAAMEKRNRQKAEMLYSVVDASPDFFRCPVETSSRSVMNAVFNLPTEDLEKKFIAEAADQGMVNTKGHRSVGGIRISMYNAMEPANVEKLAGFMKTFASTNS